MTLRNKSTANAATPKRTTRKSAAKSPTGTGTVTRKSGATKPVTKSATLKKKVVKKPTAKKATTEKAATKKPSAKKTMAKTTTKKTTAKKQTTKPSTAKKTTAKSSATKRSSTKQIAKEATAKSQKLVKKMAAKPPTTIKAPPVRKSAGTKSILYLGHAVRWNFQEHLYKPLRNSHFSEEFNLILPHEQSLEPSNTKSIIENCNVMLAEVSYPSTGLGIELGWAEVFDIPIIAFYQEGRSPTKTLKLVVHDVFEYDSMPDLIEKLSTRLRSK